MRPRYTNTFAKLAVVGGCLAALTAGGTALAETPSGASGGAVFEPPPPPPKKAMIVDGRAIAPRSAPRRVKRVIEAANRLVEKPYRYGGGHRQFSLGLDKGYDCSGSVSYALYGGRFLRSPLPSGALMNWGRRGPGRWITVYAHGGHAYVVVAGLRFDTSMRDPDAPGPGTGPRWSKSLRKSAAFVARHPRNY
ncbi:MAG: C40 family peptidase [Thermoleophilaceae bacterium]|nr:C40 family peptidase [Thermoleophilaceae bacterium]